MTAIDCRCIYCKKEVPPAPLPEMEAHAATVFFCHDCKAEYVFWSDGILASHSLYTEISGRTYRWTVGGGIGQIWYVGDPGEPGVRVNKNMQSIKAFSFKNCPNITPTNIQQKIKNILVLS